MRGRAQPTAETPVPADADLVARARSGDHEAFRILVERYQGRAYRLALRVLRDEEQAADAVQEALLRAYRSLDRFEGRSGFYTWLYRVVMNLCLDSKRRDRSSQHVEWNEQSSQELAPGSNLPGEGQSGGPVDELERAELRTAVAKAIEALPDEARRTILLREVEGLSYAEIAECLGVPKGTVMSRLHYARRRLRSLLEPSGVLDAAPGANDAGGAA